MNTTKSFSPLVTQAALAAVSGFNIPTMVAAATSASLPEKAEVKAEGLAKGTRLRFTDDSIRPAGDYEILDQVTFRKTECYKLARVRKDGKGVTKDTTNVTVVTVLMSMSEGTVKVV